MLFRWSFSNTLKTRTCSRSFIAKCWQNGWCSTCLPVTTPKPPWYPNWSKPVVCFCLVILKSYYFYLEHFAATVVMFILVHRFNNRWRWALRPFQFRQKTIKLGYWRSLFSQGFCHTLCFRLFNIFGGSKLKIYWV